MNEHLFVNINKVDKSPNWIKLSSIVSIQTNHTGGSLIICIGGIRFHTTKDVNTIMETISLMNVTQGPFSVSTTIS